LKEALIPPDHINTSLSAGVSEVIEVMMAKRKEDRYNSAEELLTDLESLQNGQPPLLAHKRFDVSELEQLEEGETIESEEEVYKEETLSRYRIAILVLSVVAVLSLLIIILLIYQLAS